MSASGLYVTLQPCEGQRPSRKVVPAGRRSRNSRTSAVLPSPGSPTITAKRGSSVTDTCCSQSSSRSRPTNVPTRPWPPRGRRGATMRRSSRAATPSFLPFASTVACSPNSKAPDQRCSSLADEYLAWCRRLLEPRRNVHSVAGRERAPFARPTDHDLSGVHPDPQREAVVEELPQALEHPERSLQCALRIVLLGGRRSEDRDDGVADELLDRPATERDLPLPSKNRDEASRRSRACSGSSLSPSAVEPTRSANRSVASFRSTARG